eukprot:XP_011663810.1 PREDICTED: uncharacterized protein LOC582261 [Strongylocentrotus purpuratus]
MVILANFSRGLYFTLLNDPIFNNTQAFHITNKSYERPGSLSKSLVYFLIFNVFLYAALIAQFVASEMVPDRTYLLKVVQGFFGSLIFIEVILFLAYGVEVYFKVKGAFANASSSFDPRTLHLSRFGLLFQGTLQIITAFFLMMSVTEAKWNESIPLLQRNSYVIVFRIVELAMVMWFPCVLWNCRSPEKLWILNPKRILRENMDEEQVTVSKYSQTCFRMMDVKGAFANASSSFDPRTLHLSRFGLLFQGTLQIITAFFLMMSVTEAKWNESIPLLQRNSYVIVFRIVELAMVMWFPCVLWNCRSPEKLWILNPKRILRENTDEEQVTPPTQPIQTERREETNLLSCRRKQEPSTSTSSNYQSTETRSRSGTDPECWICYDRDNPDLGPLITPCTCKGDVAFVHHECLRRWMLELDDSPELIKCKVCKNTYDLKQGKVHLYQGLSSRDATFCFLAFFAMGGGPGAVYAVLQAYPSSTINIVTIGLCVLLEMTCLRYLGYTIANAYKRAKIFSLKIMGKTSTSIIMEEDEASTSGELEQSSECKTHAEASSSKCGDPIYGGDEGTSDVSVVEAEVFEASRTLEQCEVHEIYDPVEAEVVPPLQAERRTNVKI